MQLDIFEKLEDFSPKIEGEKILIGLSGGINSAATLVYLSEFINERPSELHLYYAHFDEHSDDTKEFVFDCVKYAFDKFAGQKINSVNGSIVSECGTVHFTITDNSVNDFFVEQKLIPHPSISPCTRLLKIMPMAEYMAQNKIKIDLIGYVRDEKQRITKQQKKIKKSGIDKKYIIRHLANEDCFKLVKSALGWYPEIYNYRWSDLGLRKFLIDEGNINNIPSGKDCNGDQLYFENAKGEKKKVKNQRRRVEMLLKTNKRVFAHNNCLMCKNWQSWEQVIAGYFFPLKVKKALDAAKQIGSHWGRDTDQLNFGQTSCTFCEF